MSNTKRKTERSAGPAAGEAVVVGANDHDTQRASARFIETTDGTTLQGFVRASAEPVAKLFTEESNSCGGPRDDLYQEAVNHSVGKHVRGDARTNGIASFWSMLKRAHQGVCNKICAMHLRQCTNELAKRRNVRETDTIDQMGAVDSVMVGKRPMTVI